MVDNFLFPAAAIVLAMVALTVIYRVARPEEERMKNVLPGRWWRRCIVVADERTVWSYVRRVPYSIVYGGLGGGHRFMVWMQLSAASPPYTMLYGTRRTLKSKQHVRQPPQ